ncbi:Outer membrane porin protein BP0840 precursor [Pseudomonas fluorescens]|uniref:Outer membrane porin protein BP0840 n=1 Tax=Pseudomonas fluorescens TaxID=294 RepID=A0A379IG41_PSEFL|nr:porin [Pseudomonas fluorescens]SUD31772.1 Outer membrane porin protein BP0840 precursor [Pseudomonas fluorescens]
MKGVGCVSLLFLVCGQSVADDFFKPYILTDIGWSSTSNINGEQQYHYQEGRLAPNFIGIKARKELGNGYAGVLKVESGYSLQDLKITGDGLFSRQMFAGLDSDFGQVTVGKQWDFMFETLAVDRWGEKLRNVPLLQLQAGPFFNLGLPTGSIDYNRVAAGFPTDRAVKYLSPDFNGFSFGVMHGDGDPGSNIRYGKTRSFSVKYIQSPLRVMAAYTDSRHRAINRGRDGIRNYGVGAAYDFSSFIGDALYTRTENTYSHGAIDSYAIGALVPVTTHSSLYANYMYLKGNARLNKNMANQVGVTYDYRFNKNWDAYVSAVYQITGGDDQSAYISGAYGVSSDREQSVLHVGVRFYYE